MSSVRPAPELEGEAEVDLGRYARQLAARWWLLLAGAILGAIIGYLATLGGTQNYRGQAVVYLGQPLGPISGTPVASLNTNPSAARAIVTADSVLRRVSRATGLGIPRLRSDINVKAVAGALTKIGQTPLIQITVTDKQRAKVAAAANLLANTLVQKLSGPADAKIAIFEPRLAADRQAITAANTGLSQPGLSTTDKLFLQIRLQAIQADASDVSQQLAAARDVEAPHIVTGAASVKSSLKNHRNSTLVGAVIGLILGAIAALLWEPIARSRHGTD
jgi:subunit length determinant Wzz-like protein